MKLYVKDLVAKNNTSGLEIFWGEQYLDNEIKGVTIIEAPDIVKFINGGEVLLTSLYAFRTCSIDEMKMYINELEDKKVSAVIMKKGRKVEYAKEKIELFIEYAKRSKTPLLSMEFDRSFKDIMQIIMTELFNDEVKLLKYFKTTRDNFEALIYSLKPEEDGVVKLLTVLGKLIGNPVGVYDQNGICIGKTKFMPSEVECLGEYEEVELPIVSNYKYKRRKVHIYDNEKAVNQYVIHMKNMYGIKMYLVVPELGDELDIMDYIAIESAISTLWNEFSRRYAVLELEKKYQNDIIHNILHGESYSIEDMKKNIGLLGMSWSAKYRIVILGMEYIKGREPKDINDKVEDINILKEGVIRIFPKAVVINDIDKVIMIEEIKERGSEKTFRESINLYMQKLQNFIQLQKRDFEVKAGVGKIVDGIINLKNSYTEANDALEFLNIAGDVFDREKSNILMFSDMGILKLLSALRTKEELYEYIPESLKKLYSDNRGLKGDLILTLRSYLDNNQNLMKTAQELHVHHKTVAYRIEKIEDITGMNFNDPGEMLSVRIGIIVYKILDKRKMED